MVGKTCASPLLTIHKGTACCVRGRAPATARGALHLAAWKGGCNKAPELRGTCAAAEFRRGTACRGWRRTSVAPRAPYPWPRRTRTCAPSWAEYRSRQRGRHSWWGWREGWHRRRWGQTCCEEDTQIIGSEAGAQGRGMDLSIVYQTRYLAQTVPVKQ